MTRNIVSNSDSECHPHTINPVFNIQKARDDTPGCKQVLHFNNAGAALMPYKVTKGIIDYLNLESHVGSYEAAELSQKELSNSYTYGAQLLNCQKQEIAFTENASSSWRIALRSIPLKSGDRIITNTSEYISNFLEIDNIIKKTGVIVDIAPDDEYGQVSVDGLANLIDDRVKVISITHIPTNCGLVNPIVEIGELARQANILYIVDACQSIGQIPLDVQRIQCDFLTAAGRKYLRGPRGTGILYVRQETLELLQCSFLDVYGTSWYGTGMYSIRNDAQRFESWEVNQSIRSGLGMSIKYALDWDIDITWRRIQSLSLIMKSKLELISGLIIFDRGVQQCGIITIFIKECDIYQLRLSLLQRFINVSVLEMALTPYDNRDQGVEEILRISLHYYNTEEEIETFCSILEVCINNQKKTIFV